MKLAIIGSRSLTVPDLSPYIPPDTTEILSGGAKGIDRCAREYALSHGIPLTEFLPDYARYKKGAPLRRNLEILAGADRVLIFWDGQSRGTKFCIDRCRETGIPFTVVPL